MTFSIIHPSRGRPKKSFETIQNWISRAGTAVEVIVSLDQDDERLSEYIALYPKEQIFVGKNRSAVDAINNAAALSKGDVLIVVSDDFACPRNWAHILQRHIGDRKDFVLKVSDGTQVYIVTLPIMDRAYYSRFGHVYHPDFLHMFCDTALTHQADILKKLVIRNELLFRHNHYSVTRAPKDEVSIRADATWNQGKETYLAMVRRKFDLGVNTDVLQLSPEGFAHREWLKKNGIA